MNELQKLKKLNIDLGAVGLEQRDTNVTYFCTPKGAKIIGWAGVDGIHYCTICGLGETVFAVSPMNESGNYVHPIALSVDDLMRILLVCGDMAAVEQAHQWDEQQFLNFIEDYPPTEKQKAVLAHISEALGIQPMDNAFAYIRGLQSEFDYAQIKFTQEYYDLDMNPSAAAEDTEWKVTFDGRFGQQRGRAGKEIPVNKSFQWDGQNWFIPAVYTCSKGLVVDICMEAEPEGIKAFIEKWDLLHEEEHCYSKDEMHRMQQEHPLNIDFHTHAVVNGKPLRNDHGIGVTWIPESCFDEGTQCELEAKRALEHYALDFSRGWMIRRCCFAWATAKKPEIKSLTLTLDRAPADILGISFVAPPAGECISFTHPLSGVEHTLTVHEYERNELDTRHFLDMGMEYPTHHHAMSYSLSPDLPNRSFIIRDSTDGDDPRIRKYAQDESSSTSLGSAAAIGIIGGADGPTAIILSSRSEKHLHAACSLLHFEPVEQVEWQITFREKMVEDVKVDVI